MNGIEQGIKRVVCLSKAFSCHQTVEGEIAEGAQEVKKSRLNALYTCTLHTYHTLSFSWVLLYPNGIHNSL